VDEVGTSDDLLLNLMEGRELVGVRFAQRKRLLDRFTNRRQKARTACCWLQRGQKPLL
jgi:serine protease SohB